MLADSAAHAPHFANFGDGKQRIQVGWWQKSEARVKLDKLLHNEKDSLVYAYDFGDGWEHQVLLEKILHFDETVKTPICIKGKLTCPPEDCGGIYGYYDLLKTLADPKHPGHEDMLDWLGGEFDPEAFSIEEVHELLADFAD